MKTSIPRLRSVRPKAGGATVTVLRSPAPPEDDVGRKMVDDARVIASYGPVKVYAVVAIHDDEANSIGLGGMYALRAFPAIAHDIILQELFSREVENS